MADAQRLAGRVALVTGGGSGMGRATALRLASDGARVLVVDQHAESAVATAREIGAAALGMGADVTDEQAVASSVETALKHFGRLDIGVNAAGIAASVPLVNQTVEQFRKIQEVNLTGVFLTCREQSRQMIAQGEGGVIINFVSTNALQPGEGLAAYCASKAGVAILTRVAAMELAEHRIRVVGVGPGLTATPMASRFLTNPKSLEAFVSNIPLGRPAEPEEVAGVAAFLASDDAAYITGETIYVEGGALTRRYPGLGSRTPTP
ncbi:SDR family NAD(P)-dependent oxidoreductase [Streptomyces sp. NPDC096354]|uniref:SDR family NAD(P)-dependent oxidoreductase n=1 Tax=Streptomyces sp. NPDC096354 TaxID=3366088 RepID=UPI003826ECFE